MFICLCYSHTVANILANMNIWNSRQIRRKLYDWPGEIVNKIRPYKWFRMLVNVLRMPRQFYECLRMPYERNKCTTHAWRIAYKLLDNSTNHGRVSQITWTCSQHMVTWAPRNCKFSLNMVNSPWCSHTVANMVANGLTHILRSLQMPCHHYTCLAINTNGFRLLTKMLRKQCEFAIRQEFRNMFLNIVLFATTHEWLRMLTNTY
jgi:hypothetical protein